jgi:hypothetical protein
MATVILDDNITTHEIIVAVLRKHLITRKIAGKIADEIIKETEVEYNRHIRELSPIPEGVKLSYE